MTTMRNHRVRTWPISTTTKPCISCRPSPRWKRSRICVHWSRRRASVVCLRMPTTTCCRSVKAWRRRRGRWMRCPTSMRCRGRSCMRSRRPWSPAPTARPPPCACSRRCCVRMACMPATAAPTACSSMASGSRPAIIPARLARAPCCAMHAWMLRCWKPRVAASCGAAWSPAMPASRWSPISAPTTSASTASIPSTTSRR